MAISIIRLNDEWAVRKLRICVRSLDMLPNFARQLIGLLIADGCGDKGNS